MRRWPRALRSRIHCWISRTALNCDHRAGALTGTHSPRVYVYRRVVDGIEKEVHPDDLRETGGVLLGYRASSGEWMVTAAYGPGPRAIRSRSGLAPDTAFNAELVREAFRVSGGVVSYLGEWHTHPRGSLLPSKLDQQTATAISRRSHVPAHLLFPIMRRSTRLVARIYVFDGTSFSRARPWLVVEDDPQVAQRSERGVASDVHRRSL